MAVEVLDRELRVLLYAPAGKDAALTARVLASADIDSYCCNSMQELVDECVRGAGALLVMEETLTPASLRLLTDYTDRQPPWSDINILIVTRQGADSPDLQTVMDRLRNYTLLERPLRTRSLISIARSALNARRRQYQVREAEQRKDEFLASLAHELRNPLAPIRTAMGVLGAMYPAASGVTRVRDVVERQIEHLTRLVDDLLDVARITSGKIELQRQQVALSAVIAHALEMCAPLLAEAGHQIDVNQPSRDVLLDVDPVRVVQSLANILGNAIKFMPQPGRIDLHAEVEGECVSFRVRDTGIGLDAAALTRIFEMFAQSEPAQQQRGSGGLGIGLSLAKRFAEMHGGSISASSAGPGCGSEFVMSLPVVCGTAVLPQDKVGDDIGLNARADNRHLLVVDDNRDGADMLQLLLEADGFTVTAAYDGRQALEAVAYRRPDIVVMDIGMPGMDGYEAVRHIRALPGGAQILMIALTGWGEDSAKHQAIEAGFDHHLVKPVDFTKLRALLGKG